MRKIIILYVEDDPLFAKKYAKTFEENGFLVALARDETEAIRLFREKSPDIAVLDIKLQDPRKGGFWVAKKIRESNMHIPVLFLTSFGDEETAIKGFEAGGFDFIRKSVGSKELIARINRSLKQHNPLSIKPKQKIVITPHTYLDLIDNTLISHGHTENLSQNECNLLQILLWYKNDPQYRNFVMNHIWSDAESAPEYMSKAVCQLRKLLSRDKKIQLITKRDAGIALLVEEN